jgi:large conductance mechanosensitive channel
MTSTWEEFKKFAFKGNVLDLAVGVVIGAAFTGIVKNLVDNVIMPPLGWLVGGIDFSQFYLVLKPAPPGTYATVDEMVKAGAVLLRYGLLVNALVSFLLIAFAVFLLVKGLTRLTRKREEAPTTRDCPRCLMAIPLKATRCGHCTSEVEAAAG